MREITDIKEIQKHLFDELLFFKKICEENNLSYWLSNGTLLGAIKYKGFIPWDDDVDVMMPYDDFKKLLELKISNDKYTILAPGYDSWEYPYAKISDNTTLVKEGNYDFGVQVGVSLDIFPVEPWCGGRKRAILQAEKCSFLCRCMYTSRATFFYTDKTGIKRWILKGIYCFSKLMGSDYFKRKIEKEAKKGALKGFNEFLGSIRWAPYGKREVVISDIFKEIIQVEFGGELFNAPLHYDKYLSQLYGEYMSDLPVEKQVSNHCLTVWKI